jgi:hypothetical protein
VSEEKEFLTEAEKQIERLKKLKVEKENSAIQAKKEAFDYDTEKTEYKPAPEKQEKPKEHKIEAVKTEPVGIIPEAAAHTEAIPPVVHVKQPYLPGTDHQKFVRTVRVDKLNFDEVHRIVNVINRTKKKNRMTKDKFINLLLKRFLELDINYEDVEGREDLENLMERLDIK